MDYFQNERWNKVPERDVEQIKKDILGYVDSESLARFNPDFDLLMRLNLDPSEELSILDLGCGLGRNMYALSKMSPKWDVVGYDNPRMIGRARTWLAERNGGLIPPNITLTSDWHTLKKKSFDATIAMLVFQHIVKSELQVVLKDLALMTDKLLVYGLSWNEGDPHTNTWDEIQNYFTFDECSPNFTSDLEVNKHFYAILTPGT